MPGKRRQTSYITTKPQGERNKRKHGMKLDLYWTWERRFSVLSTRSSIFSPRSRTWKGINCVRHQIVEVSSSLTEECRAKRTNGSLLSLFGFHTDHRVIFHMLKMIAASWFDFTFLLEKTGWRPTEPIHLILMKIVTYSVSNVYHTCFICWIVQIHNNADSDTNNHEKVLHDWSCQLHSGTSSYYIL